MKKLILIFLLLRTAGKSYSQTYIPFPTDSVFWRYYADWLDAGANGLDYILFLNGDTTIVNGHTYYNVMYREHYSTYQYATPDQTLVATSPDILESLIREENKRIYAPGTDSTETLLFDFNLQVGDTLSNMYPVYVWFITTMTLSDEISRPVFDLSNNTSNIEGIGNGTWGVVSGFPYADICSCHTQLVCFHNETTGATFSPTYAPCNYIYPYGTPTSVTNVTGNEIKVYPNLFINELNIETFTTGDACLYNNSGQMVLRQKLAGAGVYPISDIAKFPSGVYYLIVKDNNGNVLKKEELSKL